MKQLSGSAAVSQRTVSAPSFTNGRAAKRDRIIAAALKLFARQPYQEVTMDSVARLATVAKGTLYLYFDSKEALYLGILTDGFEKGDAEQPGRSAGSSRRASASRDCEQHRVLRFA